VRPLTVLTAIVLGSAVATTFSLAATAVVYLVLVNKHPQFVEIIKKILALPGNLKWLRYTSISSDF